MRELIRRAWEVGAGMDRVVFLSIIAVVGGGWLFLAIADEVVEGESARFDEAVLLMFRNPENPEDAIGGPEIEELIRDLTALGGVAIISLVTISAVVFLIMDRKGHAAVLVLLATVGGQLISSGLKAYYDRPRPEIVPHLMHAARGSFPSGHSLLAAVTYLTIGALLAQMVTQRRLKVFILGVAVIITMMVGVSRIYLGVHYPTDVLAGWTLGFIWATLCAQVAQWLRQRGMVEQAIDA
ncbi:phosphatase PAP2 family protein [Tautonia rosea]|uniref:phosphatase PAP2 family protein n=1 Tax=Tautonia rosea TaxID=2728037 RepID=UPI0019D10BB4|nr:phosphatase PAP2 family protein [Tautonia rosea]